MHNRNLPVSKFRLFTNLDSNYKQAKCYNNFGSSQEQLGGSRLCVRETLLTDGTAIGRFGYYFKITY